MKKLSLFEYEWCLCKDIWGPGHMCGCGDKHVFVDNLGKTAIHWMGYHWTIDCAFKAALKAHETTDELPLIQLEWVCEWRCKEVKLQQKRYSKKWKFLRPFNEGKLL